MIAISNLMFLKTKCIHKSCILLLVGNRVETTLPSHRTLGTRKGQIINAKCYQKNINPFLGEDFVGQASMLFNFITY